MGKMTLEQKEEIKALALKYGIDLRGNGNPQNFNTRLALKTNSEISLEDIHLLRFNIFLFPNDFLEKWIDRSKITWDFLTRKLVLAEYILLLSKALENKTGIEVSTTIKGIKEKVHLQTSDFIYLSWLQANSYLEEIQDGLYQYQFNWEFREYMNEKGCEHFTIPYTKEELEMILNYERQETERIRKGKITNRLKWKINKIREEFRREGVFSNEAKELTSKEYQFLYDTLSVLGFFPRENMKIFSGTDKKEALRDYIRIK